MRSLLPIAALLCAQAYAYVVPERRAVLNKRIDITQAFKVAKGSDPGACTDDQISKIGAAFDEVNDMIGDVDKALNDILGKSPENLNAIRMAYMTFFIDAEPVLKALRAGEDVPDDQKKQYNTLISRYNKIKDTISTSGYALYCDTVQIYTDKQYDDDGKKTDKPLSDLNRGFSEAYWHPIAKKYVTVSKDQKVNPKGPCDGSFAFTTRAFKELTICPQSFDGAKLKQTLKVTPKKDDLLESYQSLPSTLLHEMCHVTYTDVNDQPSIDGPNALAYTVFEVMDLAFAKEFDGAQSNAESWSVLARALHFPTFDWAIGKAGDVLPLKSDEVEGSG